MSVFQLSYVLKHYERLVNSRSPAQKKKCMQEKRLNIEFNKYFCSLYTINYFAACIHFEMRRSFMLKGH